MFVVYKLRCYHKSFTKLIVCLVIGLQCINALYSTSIYAQKKDNPTVLRPSPIRIKTYQASDWPYSTPSFLQTVRAQLDVGIASLLEGNHLTLQEFIGIDSYIPIQTQTRTWGHFVFQWFRAILPDTPYFSNWF